MALPERFQVSRNTLLVDRAMNRTIRFGGAAVIVAVSGILLFVVLQILPLFRGARLTPALVFPATNLSNSPARLLGADEWMEAPFVVDDAGVFHFYHLSYAETNGKTYPALDRLESVRPDVFPPGETPTAFAYDQERQEIALGGPGGRFAILELGYAADFSSEKRAVRQGLRTALRSTLGKPGAALSAVAFGGDGDRKLAAAIQPGPSGPELYIRSFVKSRSLEGEAALLAGTEHELTTNLPSPPVRLLVKKQADGLLAILADGSVAYLAVDDEGATLRQIFTPFEDLPEKRVGNAEFIFGDVSVSFVSAAGEHRVFSLYARADRDNLRLFGRTKSFAALSGAAGWSAHGIRNKTLLLGEGRKAALCYTTTESVRWRGELPVATLRGILGGKNDKALFLGADRNLHLYDLVDRHPEVSWTAFFGKVWYEGSAEPKYEWQSTGGTDDFEPKLSLVPLILGTLKGTFYALLFAVPLGLLAALYTSQFLSPGLKGYVKPVMELSASLPSVVLGFIAALILAPLVENRVPSILLILIFTPAAAIVFGALWARQPARSRARIPAGWEFAAFAPVFLAAVAAAWLLGPPMERLLFTVADPATGTRVADFKLWFTHATGLPFEQRNSLVVGFIMGFAVMPILFTIAEDALSNVPDSMRSGALALGASRWQTAIHVVLPTAAAGLFSAVMVAFGRAVGETMIVVMATGNTPVLDFNLFNGMRTLSANIAVELPEAPEGGTLYRTLFFGALVLFAMTFVLNTLAEILRQRLREKYKNV